MSVIPKIPFLVLLAYAASFSCHAQEVEHVKVRFVSFPKCDDPQPIELFVGENKTILVELPTNSISDAYTITKPANWSLGKTVTDIEGKSSFHSYGSTPALAAPEQLILVVRNGKADAGGLKLIAFDDRASNFGGGKYLFFNASRADIACKLGEKNFTIKPLQYSLNAPDPSEVKGDRKKLYVYMYFRKEQEAIPFYSSEWRFSEKARTMAFLYHDGDVDSLRIHMIRDYIP